MGRAARRSSERFAPVRIGWLLPLSGVQLEMIALGGFFMALTGAVAVPVGIYFIGYARREHLGARPADGAAAVRRRDAAGARGGIGDDVSAGLGVDGARLADLGAHRPHPQRRCAPPALFYAVMTQFGFAAILIGLMVLSAAGGADRFADLGTVTGRRPHRRLPVDPGWVRLEGRSRARCTPGCRAPTPRRPVRCRR